MRPTIAEGEIDSLSERDRVCAEVRDAICAACDELSRQPGGITVGSILDGLMTCYLNLALNTIGPAEAIKSLGQAKSAVRRIAGD
jgi:hypothetical protein